MVPLSLIFQIRQTMIKCAKHPFLINFSIKLTRTVKDHVQIEFDWCKKKEKNHDVSLIS